MRKALASLLAVLVLTFCLVSSGISQPPPADPVPVNARVFTSDGSQRL